MPAFRDEDALRQAIDAAGLASFADRIVATARPAILFVRRQTADADLPPGTSKIGGSPDLPPDFAWPCRPARDDADAWERSVRDLRAMADEMPDYGAPEDVVRARREREQAYDRLLFAACRRSFPLAFRAQIDLAALSDMPGFDADLPRSGVLSIFEDATGSGGGEDVRVFWHDRPASSLVRRDADPALVELSEAHWAGEPWSHCDQAETLHAVDALTIPYHWVEAGIGPRDAFFDLFHEAGHGFYPDVDGHSDFGDQLGGWPQPIQGDPEAAFDDGESISIPPGDDSVRLLFAWGGEHWAKTRLVASDNGGDGTTFVMIARDALLARRFGQAAGTYQCD